VRQHPPFDGRPAHPGQDFLSEEGAHRLAGRIRAAWAAVGIDLPCEVRPAVRNADARNAGGLCIYTVAMPTLVNGRVA
jgi:hypothetical protein